MQKIAGDFTQLSLKFTLILSVFLIWLAACSSPPSFPSPDFSLNMSESSLNLEQGKSTELTISLESHTMLSVELTLADLPEGVTASFSQNPLTDSSVLSLNASTSASPGNHTLTLQAKAQGKEKTAQFSLEIQKATTPPIASFSLSASPTKLSLEQSGENLVSVTINLDEGFSGLVSLSAADLPEGVSAGFAPDKSADGSVLTLTALGTVVPGDYSIRLEGSAQGQTKSITVQLTITEKTSVNFSLALNPQSTTLGINSIKQVRLDVTPTGGFSESIRLNVDALPKGVTASFDPSLTTAQSTLSISADDTASPGVYQVIVRGKAGSLERTAQLSLTIEDNRPPDFKIFVAPSISIAQGFFGTLNLEVERIGGFSDIIQFSLEDAPAGVTGEFDFNVATFEGSLELLIASTVAEGNYTLKIVGKSGTLERSATFILIVTRAQLVEVTIVKPGDRFVANGPMQFEVRVNGRVPDMVTLVLPDMSIVSSNRAPYTFTWNPAADDVDGNYRFIARANFGSKVIESESVIVTLDRTAPTIVSQSPKAGATDVRLADKIEIKFSEALHTLPVFDDPNQKLDPYVRLTGAKNPNLNYTWEFNTAQDTITIKLKERPVLPDTLSIALHDIVDRGNNPTKVSNWSWQVPDWLEYKGMTSRIAYYPSLVLDKDGTPIVAIRLGGNDIAVLKYTSTGWIYLGGAEDNINVIESSYGYSPGLALDASGQPIVTWEEGVINPEVKYSSYAKRWTGSSWQLLGSLTGDDVKYNLEPSLVSDGKGNTYFAWRSGSSTVGNPDAQASVYVSRWNGTKMEQLGAVLTTSANGSTTTSIKLNQTGQPFVAFLGERIGSPRLFQVMRWGGTGTSTTGNWINVGNGVNINASHEAYNPSLAMLGDTPIVTWQENDGNNENIYVRRYESGWKGYDSDSPLDNFVPNPATNPSLALSISGPVINPDPLPLGFTQPAQVLTVTPTIAFIEKDGTSSKVIVKRKSSMQFGPWVQLGGPLNINSSDNAFAPSLAFDGATPVVAWVEGESIGKAKLHVARYNDF
ncbi:MAG: Ig-like domain-containing protein [Trueperaceae bacterium]|nr:Ig-like domain-containing protein [Trueperaceae bacterium]